MSTKAREQEHKNKNLVHCDSYSSSLFCSPFLACFLVFCGAALFSLFRHLRRIALGAISDLALLTDFLISCFAIYALDEQPLSYLSTATLIN